MSSAAIAPPRVRKPDRAGLLTSEPFLEWMPPGGYADLIGGEIAPHWPVNLRHARLMNSIDRRRRGCLEETDLGELHGVREYWMPDPTKPEPHFYRREGGMFGEFAPQAERIESISVRGFWGQRAWINPAHLPKVSDSLRQVLGTAHAGFRRKQT